jgi:hypothetical protein
LMHPFVPPLPLRRYLQLGMIARYRLMGKDQGQARPRRLSASSVWV